MWYADITRPQMEEKVMGGFVTNRIIAWRIMLDVLRGSHSEQISQSWEMREDYYSKKNRLEPQTPSNLDPTIFNPLSQDTQNPWYTHFKNQEVRQNIRLDVDRTFQKLDFFRIESNKLILENVLFVWSMNNTLGYKQGMNEILAVIIYYGMTENETIDSLSSKEHIEPDSYALFNKIMDLGISKLYKNNEYMKNRYDTLSEIPTVDRSNDDNLAVCIKRCHYIFHKILSNVDYELYQHILKSKFEPQLFLLRWLRCLLCREFDIENIGRIWDFVFCMNNGNFELEVLDYFCIAMMVKSRELCKKYIVLRNVSLELLQILMKPLVIEDINNMIELAVSYYKNGAGKKIVSIPEPQDKYSILPKIYNLFNSFF